MIRITTIAIVTAATLVAPSRARAQQSCRSECAALVREAIRWIIDEYDVMPSDLVIDPERSGIGPYRQGRPG